MLHRIASALVFALVTSAVMAQFPVHYLVCAIDRDDQITVLSAEEVVLAEEPQDARATNPDAIDVELFAGGQRVFRTSVDVDRYVRAEFHGHDGRIDGRWLKKERTVFVVRIPRKGNALELTSRASRRTTRVGTADLPRREDPPAISAPTPYAVTGSPANRLDLLIIGDGYTSAQSSLFQTHVDNLAADFFTAQPYGAYQNYLNVTSYFVPSVQSGADHPNCSDGGPDPKEGTFVDTAFDSTYCTAGIQRLLTANDTKVYTAAAAVPDWDKIIVLVNDTMYGGAGGPVGVVSTHDAAVGLAQHEFGHSFTGLADEYAWPFPGYPGCSDISGSTPCEPNVTDVTTRASVKWNPWISPSTPVPTTPQESYTTVPGLFQGARYQGTFYRPRYGCLMNSLVDQFCEICKQSFILRLYTGWGGTPSAGIDPIEPGSEDPPPGAISTVTGQAETFTASVLQPAGGPATTKQWYVNSVLQGETGNSFHWTPSASGSYTIELRVKDVTPFVHTAMAGTSLQSNRIWTVTAQAAEPANFIAQGNTASVSLSWNAIAGATSYEIFRNTGSGFVSLTSVSGTTFVDTGVTANSAYAYKVRAGAGPFSTPDLATVFTASDDPLAAGTKVKAIHLTQLRTAINAARTVAGLAHASYTNTPAAGVIVRAVDIQQMRTAINAARTALGVPAFTFTNPTLNAGTTVIDNAHVIELRNATR
ncbi:MAG TPA: M64 family metallopeptidase [Thermoanaerobaculia bacterium]|nr:M64 family metallopeptidase [Thermoanaerobaculia bacterium]